MNYNQTFKDVRTDLKVRQLTKRVSEDAKAITRLTRDLRTVRDRLADSEGELRKANNQVGILQNTLKMFGIDQPAI